MSTLRYMRAAARPDPVRYDGGLVGLVAHWRRDPLIFQITTFDPTRLRPSDFIDVPRSANIFLDVFGYEPRYSRQVPWARVSFRSADSRFTRKHTRLSGFLYYTTPVPSRPLSGGLRFRCTPSPSPADFHAGLDLLGPTGLPWTVPVVNFMRLTGLPVLQSLMRDGLVHLRDIIAARASFHNLLHPDATVVHAVGQPWLLDLSMPTTICVPGPRSLLRCSALYPAVAQYGAALVHFEPAENPAHPHELALRVRELRSDVAFHPAYAHLPPLKAGSFLAHPTRGPPRMWTWNYETKQKAESAAGLYCLVHGPSTDPRPTPRTRMHLEQDLFHHPLPSDEELVRDAEELVRDAPRVSLQSGVPPIPTPPIPAREVEREGVDALRGGTPSSPARRVERTRGREGVDAPRVPMWSDPPSSLAPVTRTRKVELTHHKREREQPHIHTREREREGDGNEAVQSWEGLSELFEGAGDLSRRPRRR